uniref:Predicted protein n=1 Tax=Physcomitrium patens TaxID=3218 RepID=A9U5K0_PHYPA
MRPLIIITETSKCKQANRRKTKALFNETPVHHIEVVNAVLIKSQQKQKNPIQDIDEQIAREQVAPSMGLNEPISVLERIPILRLQQTKEPNLVPRANWSGPSNPGHVMGFVPSMRPDLVAQLNEVSITEASVPIQAILISMQFQETSYPLKDPLRGGNSKEARLLFQFQVHVRDIILRTF